MGISPATVASAYHELRRRGIAVGRGRQGTRVASRPPVAGRAVRTVDPDLVDVAAGSPDPALLPPIGPALRGLRPQMRLYGADPWSDDLRRLARTSFQRDRVPAGALTVTTGGMDGIERVLTAHLRPGDRVAVEDPGWPVLLDALRAMGLVAVAVGVDEEGAVPSALRRALREGAAAVVVTPRAQNPTGAAITRARAGELREVLAGSPATLVIEDDHAGTISGQPLHTLAGATASWAVVRSVSKFLGPDLRLAVVAGDDETVARVAGRYALGPGWVSHVQQDLVARLWQSALDQGRLARAVTVYGERRTALAECLAEAGVASWGRSGLNVWVPVAQEGRVVQALASAGWAVAPGEAFRIRSAPAIRITTARLPVADAPRLAADVAAALRPAGAGFV